VVTVREAAGNVALYANDVPEEKRQSRQWHRMLLMGGAEMVYVIAEQKQWPLSGDEVVIAGKVVAVVDGLEICDDILRRLSLKTCPWGGLRIDQVFVPYSCQAEARNPGLLPGAKIFLCSRAASMFDRLQR
jgi:hypothetical protein